MAAASTCSVGSNGSGGLEYRLVSLDPEQKDVVFKEGIEVSAGRYDSNTIITQNPYVSTRHFKVLNVGGPNLFVLDLSTNGTWIGPEGEMRKIGKPNRKLLQNGDMLSMLDPNIAANKKKLVYRFEVRGERGSVGDERWGEISKTYIMGKQIGKGNFAAVHHAVAVEDATKEVAVKVIDKKKLILGMDFSVEKLLQEVHLLQRVKHDGVIKIVDVFDDDKYLCIVLELVKAGDLFDYIVNTVNHGGFTEDEARQLFTQMIEALLYLHSKNVAHRDLKPENVLVSTSTDFQLPPSASQAGGYSKKELPVAKVTLKLSDFGLAKWTGEQAETMMTYCGTPMYLAPEVQKKLGYGLSVDMWSIGVILYILLVGKPPRDPHKGVRFPPQMWGKVSPAAQDLVAQLLTINPDKRISLHGICQHPWMQGVDIKGRELAAAPEPQPVLFVPAENSPEPDHGSGTGVPDLKQVPSSSSSTATPGGSKRPREGGDAAVGGAAKKARSGSVGSDHDTEPGDDEADEKMPAPQWQWKSSLNGDDDCQSSWTSYTAEENTRIEVCYLVISSSCSCATQQHHFTYRLRTHVFSRGSKRPCVSIPSTRLTSTTCSSGTSTKRTSSATCGECDLPASSRYSRYSPPPPHLHTHNPSPPPLQWALPAV